MFLDDLSFDAKSSIFLKDPILSDFVLFQLVDFF